MNRHRLLHFLATSLFVIVIAPLLLAKGQVWDAHHVGIRNPHVVFSDVPLGKTRERPDLLTNHTSSPVTIVSIQGTGSGFDVTGLTLPLLLAPQQSVPFTVVFAPTVIGSSSTEISLVADDGTVEVSMSVSGSCVSIGMLTPNPSPVAFGSTQVGGHQTSNITLTNAGGTNLTVTSATMSGAGFAMSNLKLPVVIPAGSSIPATITFAPPATGSYSGNVIFTTSSAQLVDTVSLPFAGAGVIPGILSPNAPSISFGSVQVGSSSSQPETLTNTGATPVTISQASATGPGFALRGFTAPVTLASGQSVSFTAFFAPATGGAARGSINIVSNDVNPNLSLPLSGTATTAVAGSLSGNPSTRAFGNVQVGGSANVTQTITNGGATPITISQASVTGTEFSISGLTAPLTLNANESVTFTAKFAPTTGGAASGTLSVLSNAANPNLNIAFSGTGAAAGQLVMPAALSFGAVPMGSSASLTTTLAATGAAVNVTAASINNSEFALSGMSLPVTLAPGQTAQFAVTFTPKGSGATSASLQFASNAANSPSAETITGTGTVPTAHSVDLTWNPSTGAATYNIYRGTSSGGPYSMIDSTTGATAYTDNTVTSGQTYYYVATAIDSNSNESGYSNETQAAVPTP